MGYSLAVEPAALALVVYTIKYIEDPIMSKQPFMSEYSQAKELGSCLDMHPAGFAFDDGPSQQRLKTRQAKWLTETAIQAQ